MKPTSIYAKKVLSLTPSFFVGLGATNGLVDRSINAYVVSAIGDLSVGGYSPGPLSVYGDDGATALNGSDQAVNTSYGTRRNLCPKPRTRPGAPLATGGYGATISVAPSGATRAVLTAAGTRGAYAVAADELAAVEAGGKITFSTDLVAMPAGRTIRLCIQWMDTSKTTLSSKYASVTGTGRRSVTDIAPPGAVWAQPLYYVLDGQIGDTLDFNYTLIEHGSVAGPYFDGYTYSGPGFWINDPGGHVGWLGPAWESASDKGCFANGTARTFSGWANRDTATEMAVIGGKATANCPILLILADGTVRFTFSNGYGNVGWVTAWPGNAQWVHWAVVADESADAVSLFINGTLISTQSSAVPYPANENLNIGRYFYGSLWDGQMSSVAVHERALTADEILDVYESAHGTTPPEHEHAAVLITPQNTSLSIGRKYLPESPGAP